MKFVKSIFIVMLFAISSMSFAQQKFGVTSAQEIMAKMPEGESIQKQLQDLSNSLVADMEATEKEYQAKVQDYQKNQASYSQVMREQKEKDLQIIVERMQQFQQTAQQELNNKQEELLAPVRTRIYEAITKVGNENGFTFIFDKAVPLYMSETLVTDVTSLVLTELGISAK